MFSVKHKKNNPREIRVRVFVMALRDNVNDERYHLFFWRINGDFKYAHLNLTVKVLIFILFLNHPKV